MPPDFVSSAMTGDERHPRAPRNARVAMAFIRWTSGRTISSADGSRSLRQRLDRLGTQGRSRGCNDAIRRMKAQGLALPIRDLAAGTFDDRDERQVVVRLQARLDDEVAVPGSDKAIRIAVSAKTPQACLAAHRVVTPAFISAE